MRSVLIRVVLVFASVFGGLVQGAEPKYFKIHNRWHQKGGEGGKAVCREGHGDEFLWRLETVGEKSLLLNKATGHVLQAAEGVCPCVDAAKIGQGWMARASTALARLGLYRATFIY